MARPGLNPAAGLLVPVVAVPAVVALVVLFFALALLPAVGGVLLPALPPVRIAAGVFVPALVVLVAVKEQGGRVIRGRGGPAWCRVCCSPGRADLGPGCSTRCRIAGGVAGVRLVRAG